MKKIIRWIKRLLGIVPSWKDCRLSSNWNGSNAAQRMMNILSPNMPESVFKQRVSFMKSRGVDTAHVFVANKKDGEYGGYSPFGSKFDYSVDKSFADVMTKRIKALRKEGLAVVLWMMADDSNDWARDVVLSMQKTEAYVKTVSDLGWFKMASCVVAGLEMDEYWSETQANVMIKTIRKFWSGKVGVHHTNDRADFIGLADILFYQVAPGRNADQIKKDVERALTYGKPVNFFEIERGPAREKCQVALDAGAFAVGNW